MELQPRQRYTLDEWLAACNPEAKRGKHEREWRNDRRAGRELI
jgi:hypothetical protein